uniref:Uncharacterized protein n=1 Tax=Rangifer tarandus platyrhynchus TaxID=3082113 RepID=A0ACB0FE81_RANTA|nr:unnamed protein product [Rangifer tarandus platyrhynchus]
MPNLENNYSSRVLFAFISTETSFVIFRTRKCMTHEKMHLHLFCEKCVNQHQHRAAEGGGGETYIQLILWRLEESSTHHNSIDINA